MAGWNRGLDRASIAASRALIAGELLMKKPIIIMAAVVAAISSAAAFAQSAPVRGVGLLALNASESRSGPGNAPGGHNALIEIPDGGGGGFGARAARGGDDTGPAASLSQADSDSITVPDALPPKVVIAPGNPAAPAAPTPKRPSYRWQSLVPGAIK
jgi:hypothetical protein